MNDNIYCSLYYQYKSISLYIDIIYPCLSGVYVEFMYVRIFLWPIIFLQNYLQRLLMEHCKNPENLWLCLLEKNLQESSGKNFFYLYIYFFFLLLLLFQHNNIILPHLLLCIYNILVHCLHYQLFFCLNQSSWLHWKTFAEQIVSPV